MLKRPEPPNDFQAKVFKYNAKGRIVGWMISLWAFYSLVGGEVTR